jgi:hypothetical protein
MKSNFVEKIVNHRKTKCGEVEYLTHWLGYPDYEDTWQSIESLKGHGRLIKEYWASTGQDPQEQLNRDKSEKDENWTQRLLTFKKVYSNKKAMLILMGIISSD